MDLNAIKDYLEMVKAVTTGYIAKNGVDKINTNLIARVSMDILESAATVIASTRK